MALIIKGLWKGIALAIPFFILCTLQLCAQRSEPQLIWDNFMAVGIAFNLDQDNESASKKDREQVISITLKDSETAIFGKIENTHNSYSFFPVMPFTSGLSYQIKCEQQIIHEFLVPFPKNISRSSVTNIFPSGQTIPANLLKIHIYFSQPMEEGRSMDYIHVLGENGDTLQNIFLNLQPELWNESQTGLTMWLDPGRIKRDLQPNLKMGPPLNIKSKYQMVISKFWKDKHGMELLDDFTKTYAVIDEDREKPDVETLEINYPAIKTKNVISIDFRESIDYEVAIEAIYLIKGNKSIQGNVTLINHESQWRFKPEEPWSQGNYVLIIESRLEDLAGNNLNRLFDRDLEHDKTETPDNHQVEISFTLPQIAVQ